MAIRTDIDRIRTLLQRTLNFQMPTGEWGSDNVSLKDRYLRVNREDSANDNYLSLFRKPNVYRTLTACEILRDYCQHHFDGRIRAASEWFTANLANGWFAEWDVVGSGINPDMSEIPHVEKLDDIRHTAQAVLQQLKFGTRYTDQTVLGLEAILAIQADNGLWPKRIGSREFELFGTACCADALYTACMPSFRRRLARLGLTDGFYNRVRTALDRTNSQLSTILERNKGLWVDEYQSSMVLERLGPHYVTDRRYYFMVEQLTDALLERFDGTGWVNSRTRPSLRSEAVHRYETTARVLASLSETYRADIFRFYSKLEPAYNFVERYSDNNVIDSSDYRYLIRIAAPSGAVEGLEKSLSEVYDYLDTGFQERHKDDLWRKQLDVFAFWLGDSITRLLRLAEGRDFGSPNYEEAYSEKENDTVELMRILLPHLKSGPYIDLFNSVSEFIRTLDTRHLENFNNFVQAKNIKKTTRSNIPQKIVSEIKDVAAEALARYMVKLTRG
jgi:hypothetical protein